MNVLRHYYAEVVFVVPLTLDLLVSWLTKYKFKNWTETRTRKLAVTAAMREQQAREIEKA